MLNQKPNLFSSIRSHQNTNQGVSSSSSSWLLIVTEQNDHHQAHPYLELIIPCYCCHLLHSLSTLLPPLEYCFDLSSYSPSS